MHQSNADLQEQVRRVAVLRAAQRVLTHLVEREPLERSIAEAQVLFDQLRSLDVATPRGVELLRDAELRISQLAADLRELLEAVSLKSLCEAAGRLAPREAAAVRALGVVLLQGDVRAPATLRAVEGLVTALACERQDGLRRIARTPLEAFPELARVNVREIHEPHPDVAQAEQVLGRELRGLADFDLEAVRARVERFKQSLGARALHPSVLSASIAFNVALGNRLIEKARSNDARACAETVPGPEARSAGDAAQRSISPVAPPKPSVLLPEPPRRSRLVWQSAGVVTAATASLVLAAFLWTGRVDVVEPAVASQVSPYLLSGYVTDDDGTARFVGTLHGKWRRLDRGARRRVLAGIASRLAAEEVDSIVLVDTTGSLQARQEGDSLHWVAP